MRNSHLKDYKMIAELATYSAYNDSKFAEYVQENLSSAQSSEEFYAKLVELKNEQKKTLEFMQELYNQKQKLKQEILKSESTLNDLANTHVEQSDFNRNTVSAYEKPSINYLKINDYESRETENSRDTYVRFDPIDEIDTKPPLPSKYSLIRHQTSDREKLQNELSENLKRIERIWENFNLDDYENINKIVEQKVPKKVDTQRSNAKSWSNRVTIVEPFNMTLRERVKTSYKEKVEREIEQERLAKLKAELDECNKKFKAQPIPAHVFLPLYEERKQREEERRHYLKQASKEYNEKVVRPFQLTAYEKKQSSDHDLNLKKNENSNFIANPLPDFYFSDDNLIEKSKEKELYRQIRNQIRAYETLKESKLPKNMELQEEKKRLELEREQERENFIKKQVNLVTGARPPVAKPKVSSSIPNYDNLYKKFANELEQRKIEMHKNTTVCKPFQFSSNNKNKLRKVTSASNSRPQSSKSRPSSSSSMQRLNQSLSTSMDALPIKSTDANLLRESATRKKINQIALSEMKHEHVEKMKKIKTKNLHEQMQTKIKDLNPNELSKSIERRTREYRLQKHKEEQNYEEQLDEMKKKVESNKFLFERVSEENARKAAEKKLRDTLKSVGISDDIFNNDKKVAKSVQKPYMTNNDNWINE